MVTVRHMLSGRKEIPRARKGDNPLPGVRETTLHSLLILGISLTRDESYTSQRGPSVMNR